MSHNVILVPAGKSQGIYVASLGLQKAVENLGKKACVFNPLVCCEAVCECSKKYSVTFCTAVKMIAHNQKTELLELIVGNFEQFKQDNNADLYIIEGVCNDKFNQDDINACIARALNCDLLMINQGNCKKSQAMRAITLEAFGNTAKRVIGDVLLNKNAPKIGHGVKQIVLAGTPCACSCKKEESSCGCADKTCDCKVVADIAYDAANYALRAKDVAKALDATFVCGDENYLVNALATKECTCENKAYVLEDTQNCGGLVILCNNNNHAVENAKAVISTEFSVLQTLQILGNLKAKQSDDCAFNQAIADRVAPAFCPDFVKAICDYQEPEFPLMAPATFRHKLTELAIKAHKRIALPEGDEPRTVCAAAKVAATKIATPVLFGKKEAILKVAAEQGVTLGEGVEFVDPEESRNKYVDRLVELRKSKGLTPEQAMDMLQDNVVLATMMLEANEVDGLVSGAVHTTANTIRPPLQIIKTAPNASLVSSVFFMLMPDQVYVFGDCAINPNPKAADLAEIAIQSADTAKTFGIDPRVAMLSYSTINSGKGPDVDTVVEAVKIVKEKRPDINVDGPLQYDASVMANVAAQKAPNSPVAGKATVFIFPSLEAGNICYKAVQRSADLVSIGPMLQGMRKPVNDLSRGALVDDIIYTIAITAIQATQA